jgi:hypothetical protein
MTKRDFLNRGMMSLFFFLVTGWAHSASAGTLTIETATSVSVVDNRLLVTITALNKGTETARDVQIHLMFLDRRLNDPVHPQVRPGESITADFEDTLPDIKKGRYPLTVQVDFHDSNHYPFSALSGNTFFYKEDVIADLSVLAAGRVITEMGKVDFDMTNLGEKPIRIQARLVLPKELSTPLSTAILELDARSKANIDFEVSSFSALNASYPVFCYFEYELNDTHYTQVARAVVTVTKKEHWFRRTRWVWIVVGCLLGAGFMLLLVINRKTTDPRQ